MSKYMNEKGRIKLLGVKLSYPSLYRKAVYEGKQTKYEATLLIPKSNKELIKTIEKDIEDKISNSKINRVTDSNSCFKDGDDLIDENTIDHYVLKASNHNKPNTLNRDRSELSEDEAKDCLYAGAIVNAIVSFWISEGYKKLSANLYGIQFVKHSKPFGKGANIDVTNEFDDIEDDEDDEDDIPF